MPQLRTFLASSNALSEAAMAKQTGTGLQPSAIITNDQGYRPESPALGRVEDRAANGACYERHDDWW
jgi:hypothetical protein